MQLKLQKVSYFVVLLVLTAAACGENRGPAQPDPDPDPVQTGERSVDFEQTGPIEARLVLAPASVAQRDTVMARVTLTNTSIRAVELTFYNSCVSWLKAYRQTESGREPVPLSGTQYGCLTVMTERTIPAGDSLVWARTLIAGYSNDPYNHPMAAGSYVIRAEFPTELPPLEAPFEIRQR